MLEGEKRILIPMLVYGIETRDERHNIFKDFNQILLLMWQAEIIFDLALSDL